RRCSNVIDVMAAQCRTSGIWPTATNAARSTVSRLRGIVAGYKALVQRFVDCLRQLAADAANLRQILDPCTRHALQSAKLLQQLATPARPQAGHRLQDRLCTRLSAALSVSGDCESMCLVTYTLDEEQCRRIGRQYDWRITLLHEEALLPGTAICAFCNTCDANTFYLQLLQNFHRLSELPRSTVDE